MKPFKQFFLAFALSTWVAVSAHAIEYADSGRFTVHSISAEWSDPARQNRQVPVKIYFPSNQDSPAPVILLSHGLGGSREGYRYLGMHLASHGYVVVHVQHHGSDVEVLRSAKTPQEGLTKLRQAVLQLENTTNRPKDISFVLDELAKLNAGDKTLKGKLDLEKVGIVGHSYGGHTALAIAGQALLDIYHFRDKRISAAIAMSPPAVLFNKQQYQDITIPVMVMTGTLDNSPLLGGTALQREGIYDALVNAPRYLLVFQNGDHLIFSGRKHFGQGKLPGTKGDPKADPQFQSDIQAMCLAFFDTYLLHDPQAKTWLDGAGAQSKLMPRAARWQHAVPISTAGKGSGQNRG